MNNKSRDKIIAKPPTATKIGLGINRPPPKPS